MQCNDCLNNKNGICIANNNMSSAYYEHCFSFEDKSLYMRGAREFAEVIKSQSSEMVQAFIDRQLADWQKEQK